MITKSIYKVVTTLFAIVTTVLMTFVITGLVHKHKAYYNKPHVNQKAKDFIFKNCINTPCLLEIDGVEFNIEVNKGGKE